MFHKDIRKVDPTLNVNDKNINIPLDQLQDNINYILNYLNGNKLLLPAVYGNLFDFNQDGKRIFSNAGKFDSLKKCHIWKAFTGSSVSNDIDVFEDTEENSLVYKGQSNLTVSRDKWIEREIYIPEICREQQLVLSLKGTGCTSQDYDSSALTEETVAVQILGGKEDIQDFFVLGPWSDFDYYTNSIYTPKVRSYYIPIETTRYTDKLKIRILRTVNTGYLHINRMYLGALTLPYAGYILKNIDINEFYNYDEAITRIVSNTVMGHKVPESIDVAKGNDLVTVEMLAKILQLCICPGGTVTPATTASSGSPACDCVGPDSAPVPPINNDLPSPTVYPNIFDYTI